MNWTSYIEMYKYINEEFVFLHRSVPLTSPTKEIEILNFYTGKKHKVLAQGIIQPSLWVDEHCMHAFFRSSNGIGKIYHAHSLPENKWTEPKETGFLNPNSGIDTIFYKGSLFLVYNPSDIHRFPLVVSEIKNENETLDSIVIREDIDTKNMTHSRELSYPYMIEKDGKIHLTYTYGRSKIEYVVIDLEKGE